MQPLRILSTRKLLPNQRQFLLNAGFSVLEADFISVKPVASELSHINDFLLFTSQNAVRSILENAASLQLKSKPCLCVGTKTKELLEKNGFVVSSSFDNAQLLADHIIERYSKKSFTFFAGNLRLDLLPSLLKAAEVTLNEYEVYKTEMTPLRLNSTLDGILFFSPSGVHSFLQQNRVDEATCFCIGNTTAKALENHSKNILISKHPMIENTIIQCINHFKFLRN